MRHDGDGAVPTGLNMQGDATESLLAAVRRVAAGDMSPADAAESLPRGPEALPGLLIAARAEVANAEDDARRVGGRATVSAPEGARLWAARVLLRELEVGAQMWGAPPQDMAAQALPGCACGAPGAPDRRCLGCGVCGCAECMMATGGAAHARCGGPVWADKEELTPARQNPCMKGY